MASDYSLLSLTTSPTTCTYLSSSLSILWTVAVAALPARVPTRRSTFGSYSDTIRITYDNGRTTEGILLFDLLLAPHMMITSTHSFGTCILTCLEYTVGTGDVISDTGLFEISHDNSPDSIVFNPDGLTVNSHWKIGLKPDASLGTFPGARLGRFGQSSMQGFIVCVDTAKTYDASKSNITFLYGSLTNGNSRLRSSQLKAYTQLTLSETDKGIKDRMWVFADRNSTYGYKLFGESSLARLVHIIRREALPD